MSVDAVVVGSGASGAWMARTLAEGGARVLLLEAGPLFPGDHRVDRTSHLSRHQPVQSRSSAYEPANSHLFVDDLAHPYETADDTPFDWFRGRQVGGRLLLWAGVCPRMTDRQLSGEGTGRRWPIRLTDLAPHYQRVEQFMRVTATSPTRAEARLAAAVSARWPGRRVLPAPTATTAAGSILAAALRTGRVQLRPEALVSHLEMAPGESRARAVVFVDTATGTTHRQEAAVIALCASTVETVRILLNTRTGGSPDGLGNEHDQLGRHLLDHVAGAAVAGVAQRGTPGPRPTERDGFVPVCLIPDFGGGYGVTLFAPDRLPASSRSAAWAASHPGCTPFRMWAAGEVLPSADNRITLSDRVDAFGVPVPRLRLAHGPRERDMVARQVADMAAMAAEAGFETLETSGSVLPPGSSVHELGGAAMGEDPRTSVVDRLNRLWAAPNVVVGDGASFATSGWQQPTLTIMALAARAASELRAQARRGEPVGAGR